MVRVILPSASRLLNEERIDGVLGDMHNQGFHKFIMVS